jgi:tight adherence protein C
MIRSVIFGIVLAMGFALCVVPSLAIKIRSAINSNMSKCVNAIQLNTGARLKSDLVICDIDTRSLVASKLIAAVIGFAASATCLFLMQSSGIAVSVGMKLLSPFVAAAVGFLYPEHKIRQISKARRRSFLHSFSSFLDLTNILLAGGAGTETALIAASESGDGWSFEQIRRALTVAKSTRISPWIEISRLGEMYALPQIKEIAGSIQLAGEHGARIRTSLAARAESLRYRQMSEVESSANSATERMGLPMVLLFISFIVLIGFPAVSQVIGGL